MRAELKTLDSVDAPLGLASFTPEDPDNFAIEVAATVGSPDAPGGDLFFFSVCTAAWLQSHGGAKGFVFLHGHLLVTRWNYEIVHRAISDLCRHTEGKDWDEVATALSRYGHWEFESYSGDI